MAKKREVRSRRERRIEGASRPAAQAGRPVELSPESLDRIPRWLPPTLYALLTLLLFREFIFSSERMLYGEDTLTLGYMARDFFAQALRTTGFPLWNPVILGGTPFLESLAGGDSLYPPSLLFLLLSDTYRALGWKLVLHVFLAGCFMHGWLRILGASRSGALVGGLAYLLAPYLVTLVFPGHDGKIFVTALAPLLFWCGEWSWRRPDLLPFAALGGVVALVLLTTHFQMAYFLFGALGVYMGFRAFQVGRGRVDNAESRSEMDGEGEGVLDRDRGKRALRRFGTFILFSILGAGAAGVQLLPAVEYVTEHSRRTATTTAAAPEDGVAYSSSWSLHPEEAVSLVVPEFVGNTRAGAAWASNTYWGRNLFKLNHEYLGLVALLLAALLFVGRGGGGIRWYLAGLGGTALLFALGANTPVWRIFYELLPGISLFRAPSMAIFLTGFAVATAAGLGLDRGVALVVRGEGRPLLRLLGAAFGLLAVASILAASGALLGIWQSILSGGMTEARTQALIRAEPFILRGFWIATVLSLLVFLIWLGVTRGILTARFAAGALALLVVVDEFRVDEPFLQTLDFAAFVAPDPNEAFLVGRGEFEPPFRVFSMMQSGQDVRPGMYGIDLAAGHHPNDLARYRALIGMKGSGIPMELATFNPNVLRLLNVRYVLWPDAQVGPIEGIDPLNQLTLPDGTVFSSVYSYPGLPRARVVGEVLVVGEGETLDVILGDHSLSYDPFSQTVLTEPPPLELGGPGVRGSAVWIERSPNRLLLEVESSGAGMLVLSENWFPGWRARIDGVETPVLRADHTLRAVALPGGRHRVEFWYAPTLLRIGLFLTLACSLGLAGVAGGILWRARRRGELAAVSGEG